MSDPLVLVSTAGAVRTLTLNRPAQLNSFTAAIGFCAGQDLNDSGMNLPGADVGAVVERHYKPLALRVRSFPVPVIAMVNGVAAGAGANFAFGCDFTIAARSASFIQAFSKIGLIPDCGGTWLLPRLVGRARAIGLAMLGDKLPAEEAERLGLIWRCVDDAALADTTMALANKLAAMPSSALAATRIAIDEALPMAYADALQAEAVRQGELGDAHDFREGVDAFLAKRAPVFTDR